MRLEEQSGGGKCFPAAWGMVAAKPCDSCKSAAALLFCRVDSAFLCMGCDSKIHRVGTTSRHERVWMCEVCEQAPASVTCKADAAALCVMCDRDIHSANPLAQRHERFPVAPFYDTAESVVTSAAAAATFLVPASDETTDFTTNDHHHVSNKETSSHTCLGDTEITTPPSWVPPNPTTKLAADDPPEMKSIELLFSESDQFLDFDYPISLHNTGTDSVVPVQTVKSLHPTMNQSLDNYLEIDFTSSKFNSYNNNSYAAQSLSQSISSSSMDVGVVPDGNSMSDISYPFGRTGNSSADLAGSMNAAPCHGMDREARVLRYREKRKNRKFEKTIRYASRKAYAETRPRIKGRFAKRVEPEADVVFGSGSSSLLAEAAGYGVVPTF